MRTYTVGEPGDLVDSAGHVRAAYDVPDGTLVLVRPDGYVGLVTSRGSAVAEYWTALHGSHTVSLGSAR